LNCAVDNLRAQGHPSSWTRHSEGTKKIGKKETEAQSFEKSGRVDIRSDACVSFTDSAGRKVTLSDVIAEFGCARNESIIHE